MSFFFPLSTESEVQENLIPNCDEDTLDDDDDVIDLPGNPEDEADIITLVDKLSISDMNESESYEDLHSA